MSSFEKEFMTVDLVLASEGETKAVDAFCLAWIKFERQLRKLTANLLYQASVFNESDDEAKEKLRSALLKKSRLNYRNFLGGIHRLTGHSAKTMLGDRYGELKLAMARAHGIRNKIFHGLQTGEKLDRATLVELEAEIREHCMILAQEGLLKFGYDGFGRDSLHKTNRHEITRTVDLAIKNGGWQEFIAAL